MMADYTINWDKSLPYALMQYRIGIIERYNAFPFMLLYGRKPGIPHSLVNVPSDFELYFMDPIEYLKNKEQKLKFVNEQVRETNEKMKEKIEKENAKRSDPDDLKVGDKVLMKKHSPLKRKFESLYEDGEFEVVEAKGQGAYRIRDNTNGNVWSINRKDLAKVNDTETETERAVLCLTKGRMLTEEASIEF